MIDFEFRYCFGEAEMLLSKAETVMQLPLIPVWDMWFDNNRQGYRIEFPIRVRPVLAFSPVNHAHGVRIPVESVTIDFAKIPVSE